MYNFHVLGVATTETNKKFAGCPYTSNARMLIDLLVSQGHHVKHYCNPGSETQAEQVYVTKPGVLAKNFGDRHATQYHAEPKPEPWGKVCRDFSIACGAAIRENFQPGDFVLLPSDGTGDVIGLIEDLEDVRIVETNVGYHDPVAPYRIFHTHVWRSAWRSRAHRAQEFYDMFKDQEPFIQHNPNVMLPIWEPRFVQDTVIQPFFNPAEFPYSANKEDYFLFLGRIIANKGIMDAVKLAEVAGVKLIIAGPGDFETEFGVKPPKHVEFVGMADLETRGTLIAKARTLLALTRYSEPCGYVVPEAMLGGTPPITCSGGGFVETLKDGVSGFVGDSFLEWEDAVNRLDTLKPEKIRQYAMDNFTADAVSPKYERFWHRIDAYHKADQDAYFGK